MDNDAFQRAVLIGLAEMVELLGMLVYRDPYISHGGRYRQIANDLREEALGVTQGDRDE